MEAQVEKNVKTKQTKEMWKRKEKMHNEFFLEGKTVDSLIMSHRFVVHHIGIALLKLKRTKKHMHTRMRFYSNSVATC